MPTEIERKFLVRDDSWRARAHARKRYRQGYLPGIRTASVRIRVAGEQAYLNIKSATLDVTRHEYEYAIPLKEAEEMLELLCEKPLIEKTRYLVEFSGHTWEVDEFEGENAGLVVAELELAEADAEFDRPSWVGEEVSDQARYYNVSLVRHPFSRW